MSPRAEKFRRIEMRIAVSAPYNVGIHRHGRPLHMAARDWHAPLELAVAHSFVDSTRYAASSFP